MKIDAVYVLGPGSVWGADNELRFSLRALSENAVDLGRVFIAGVLPPWAVNVTHIPADDIYRHNRDANIFHKTKLACECPEISDEFLFINDDHFLTGVISCAELPPFSKGCLSNNSKMFTARAGSYLRRLKRTYNELKSRKLSTWHYDIHCPIRFNKRKWLETMGQYEWNTEYGGFVMKSLYGNTLGLGYHHMSDCKIKTPHKEDEILEKTTGRWVFSVGDDGLNGACKNILRKMFPKPSIYEKRK